jgi:hypothetical protein
MKQQLAKVQLAKEDSSEIQRHYRGLFCSFPVDEKNQKSCVK